MKTTIGITWIPRGREYFSKSIKTIDHDNVIIYPDGYEFPFPTKYEVRNLGDNIGCFKHYYRVLEDLVNNTDSEVVGIFADDLLYRKGWIQEAIKPLMDSSVGYTVCYVPNGLKIRNGWRDGWNEFDGGWHNVFGGGFLFRKEVAKQILQHPFILNHLANYKQNQQIDLAIPEAMKQIGLKQLFHVPSFINHIGLVSTIGHKHQSWMKGAGWVVIAFMLSIFTGCSKEDKEYNCVQCYVAGTALNDICQEDLVDLDMTVQDVYDTYNGTYLDIGDTTGIAYCELHN